MAKKIDIIDAILVNDAGGDRERLVLKYKLMRKDPFVFFRGTCPLFYARLPALGELAEAPLAWNCGDLHLENFGSYKGSNDLVYFDLNDFDEAVLAPCIWDMIRVMASIRLAGLSLKLKKNKTEALGAHFLKAYADALLGGKARWIESETASGIIGTLVRDLKGKSRKAQLTGRTIGEGDKIRLLTNGDHALEADKKSKRFVKDLIEAHQAEKTKSERFKLLDIARRIAGTGSLGVERYVILARLKAQDQLALFDLKRARPSSSLARLVVAQPKFAFEAERVVKVQEMMQAVSPSGLSPIADTATSGAAARSYVLRALQPRQDRLDLAGLAKYPQGLEAALETMARLLAWAQLRSAGRLGSTTPDDLMAFADGKKWQKQVLLVAEEAAARAHKDWQTYCEAYDKGAFSRPD